MEVDEIHTQVCKLQRISCNGSSGGGGDNSSNPSKLADTHIKNHLFPVIDGGGGDNSLNPNELADTHNKNHLFPVDGGGGGDGGGDNSSNPRKSADTHNKNHLFRVGGGGGWPSSRIVRVSRTSGGKDRHSKVVTSKGLRDRRIRLSATTAVEFYDLQDRLGYDQPSKAVEWLINAAATSISELPPLDPSFSGDHHHHNHHQLNRDDNDNNNNNHSNVSVSKSSACSSTSETSKGSGNSRSGNRIRARERARDMVAKRGASHTSSFTDLLTGGINGGGATVSATTPTAPMDYFQMPQFNISAGDNPPQQHRFCFQENFTPVVTARGGGGGGGGGGGEGYHNLSFSIIPPPSSSSSLSSSCGLNWGTLQSNLFSSLPHHHHHLQRFQQSSMVDASTSSNFPLFMAPTIAAGAPDHFPATGYDSHRLQLYSDHYKETSKN